MFRNLEAIHPATAFNNVQITFNILEIIVEVRITYKIQVGWFKHNEGGISAQLQAHLLDCTGTLLVQQLAWNFKNNIYYLFINIY